MSNPASVAPAARLSAAFHHTLLGLYTPGSPLELHGHTDPKWARSVLEHESIHQLISEASSLGRIAVLCGAIDVYETNDERRERARRYVHRYVQKTAMIHEAAATAVQVATSMLPLVDVFPSFDELVAQVPRTYMALALELFDFGQRAIEPYYQRAADSLSRWRTEVSSDTTGAPSGYDLVQCAAAIGMVASTVAIVALSPSLGPDFAAAAVAGRLEQTQEAALAWGRYRAILLAGPAALSQELLSTLPTGRMWTLADMLSARDSTAWFLASGAGVELGEIPDLEKLFADHAPSVAPRLRVVRSLEQPGSLQQLHNRIHRALAKPANWQLVALNSPDVWTLIQARTQQFVLEVSATDDRPLLVLHVFTLAGEYKVSIALGGEDPAALLRTAVPLLREADDSAAIVVAVETEQDHLAGLLDDYQRTYVGLSPPPLATIAGERVIGSFNGTSLIRTELSTGRVVWDVAPGSLSTTEQLGPQDRCLVWVITNGLSARVRWDNYHLERRSDAE